VARLSLPRRPGHRHGDREGLSEAAEKIAGDGAMHNKAATMRRTGFDDFPLTPC
jgi:hypothetical protein